MKTRAGESHHPARVMCTAVTWGPAAAATEHTQRAVRQLAPVSWIPQWTVISETGFDVVPENLEHLLPQE